MAKIKWAKVRPKDKLLLRSTDSARGVIGVYTKSTIQRFKIEIPN
jgi:hypothetical protein